METIFWHTETNISIKHFHSIALARLLYLLSILRRNASKRKQSKKGREINRINKISVAFAYIRIYFSAFRFGKHVKIENDIKIKEKCECERVCVCLRVSVRVCGV